MRPRLASARCRLSWATRALSVLLWVVTATWFALATGRAAPPEPAVGTDTDPSSEPRPGEDAAAHAAAVTKVRERARQITQLIAGQLDPRVEASALFTISLVDPEFGAGGDELRALLVSIHEARVAAEERAKLEAQAALTTKKGKKGKRGRDARAVPELEPPPEPPLAGPEADPLTRARSELSLACWRFLTLPVSRREQLLADHAERQSMIAENREAETLARARLARLTSQAAQLAQLIDGELDLDVDPTPLLRLDLSAREELTADARLARALVGADGSTPPAVDSPSVDEPGGDEATVDGSDEAVDPPAGSASDSGPGSDSAALDSGTPPDAAPRAWAPDPTLAGDLARAAAELDTQRLRFLALTPSDRQAVLELHASRQQAASEAAAAAKLLEADTQLVAQVEEEMTEAVGKAAQAKREREQAEAAAKLAHHSEALRRVAEERARLLGVKEDHAIYEIELTQHKKDTLAAHEVALEWDREAAELAEQRPNDSREASADKSYVGVRAALGQARAGLREALSTIAASDSGVRPVGEALDGLQQDVDQSDLSLLRAELERSETELLELEREVVWDSADSGRDDIVMLNRARLTLLNLASDDLRERMTGFGRDGIDQVKREFDQIGLELRYRFLALPRIGRGLLDALEASPLPLTFSFFKLAFAFLLFRYWRKRATATLERWRDNLLESERGNKRVNAGLSVGIWYFARVRQPVELLLLFGVVYRVVMSHQSDMLELEVVWLVVLWLVVGSIVILLVDAIAARENLSIGRGIGATAHLRIRSLRLVGLTVVLTGLVLSLTEETVGKGAIHNWVGSLVWIAAIPIFLVLIRWWREHAFYRIQDDPEIPDNALVRWIRAHTQGWASFPAATVAGAYLFGRGMVRWVLHRATALESTRRFLAWMFRREVARQASARREDEQPVRPLEAEDYALFDPGKVPEVAELSDTMAAIANDLLDEIITLKVARRGTISAVIGERGSGKSTFLRRLELALEERAEDYERSAAEAERVEDADERHEEYARLTVRRIQCPSGGFRQLQRTIAVAVGLPRDTAPEDIVKALAEQSPLVFLIDDVHRLVRPAIGGLEGLDSFADFAREVSADASWIASIGAAAWQYVSRARGDRVFFDQVLKLPRWDEQQIGELIRERSDAADLHPSFTEIVIPRQFDVGTVGSPDQEGRLELTARTTEQQRAEAGFYRILWDYAKGNPAVALHFWRESLCVVPDVDGDGVDETRVRLFQEPLASALTEVGPTLHFVLRGVVQLEVASHEDLVACTQLPPADVADALRFAQARGWIDRVGKRGERYSITWHWYRAITDVLRHQHLLAI